MIFMFFGLLGLGLSVLLLVSMLQGHFMYGNKMIKSDWQILAICFGMTAIALTLGIILG